MVRIGLLDANEPYRVNPPAIVPDDERNRKKGFIYTVLAPTVKEELEWMMDAGNPIKFRGLYKYFVPKKYLLSLYNSGNKVIFPDDKNQITELFKPVGNLSNVDGITSYLIDSSARPLRGLNVLAEINFITEQVFQNPKDKRLTSMKVRDWMEKLQAYLGKITPGEGNVLGNYTEHYMIIPIGLWFQMEELRSPELLGKMFFQILKHRIKLLVLSGFTRRHPGRLFPAETAEIQQNHPNQTPHRHSPARLFLLPFSCSIF